MATASRYAGLQDPAPATRPTSSGNGSTTTTSGNQSSSQNSSGQQDTTSNSTTNSSSTTNSRTQNMTSSSLAALETLIATLMGGGTQQMAEDRAQRQSMTNRTIQQQAGYSKEAAFLDAQGAMSQQSRRTMEQLIPSITRAAEGAGTSGNSMRALLLQDAANKAAESASALGLKASVDYGGISAAYAGVLEKLTQPDNTAMNALLNALSIAKGAVQNTTSQTTGTSTTNTNSSTTTTGSVNSTQETNQTATTTPNSAGGNGTNGSATTGSGNNAMSSYGNTSNTFAPPENQTVGLEYRPGIYNQATGSATYSYGGADTARVLADLAGSNRWSSYTF